MLKDKKYPLKLFAIISLVIVVLTTIFVCIFGVNTSIDIGGGSQIEIKLSYQGDTAWVSGRDDVPDYVDKIEDVLSDNGCHIDSYVVEDKSVDTYLIVKIAKTNIKNADRIPAQIANKLGINQTRVGNIQKISSSFSNKQMLYIGLSILAVVIGCFLFGWLRYSLIGGVALAFGSLHNLIISIAVLFLFRVQFSMISIVSVIVESVLGSLVVAHLMECIRSSSKTKQFMTLSEDEKMWTVTKQSKNLIWLAGVIFAFALCLIFIPIRSLQLSGLSILLGMLVTAYTSIFMVPALYANLAEIRNTKEKQRLSKNVTNNKK